MDELTPEEIRKLLRNYFNAFPKFEDRLGSENLGSLIRTATEALLAKIQGKDSGIQSMYKEGITPLLTDASEVTAILPSQGKAKKLTPELKKGIYDIVLAARTEGIIGGKTKRFARYDTSEIISLMEGE